MNLIIELLKKIFLLIIIIINRKLSDENLEFILKKLMIILENF